MKMTFAAAIVLQAVWPAVLIGQVAGAPAGDEFDRLQAIYTNSLGAIESRYSNKAKAQPALFLQELETLGRGYQQKGDLKGVIAVKEERQRFQGELGSLSINAAGEPAELRALKAKIKDASTELDSRKAKELADLNTAYLNRLTAYLRQLTVQGKIDLAVAVQDEADRIQALVTQAAKKVPEPLQLDKAEPKPASSAAPDEEVADPAHRGAGVVQHPDTNDAGAATRPLLSPITAKRRTYLSDLQETGSQVGGQSFLKGSLDEWTVNGDKPKKGIFAHAPSTVTYDIAGLGAATLEGEVGLGRVNANSSVQFKVYGDSQLLWQSAVIKQGAKAGESMTERFSVKVRNVRKLRLDVDDLKDRNSDHSIWIDPRLIPGGFPAVVDAPKPQSSSGGVDLSALVDPAGNSVNNGVWSRKGSDLVFDREGWSNGILEIPYLPPRDYNLLFEFETLAGSNRVIFYVSSSRKSRMLILAMGEGMFETEPGVHFAIKRGETYKVELQVRDTSIKILLDGKAIGHSSFDQLNGEACWQLKHDGRLGVGTHETSVRFRSIRINEIAGKGKADR